MKDRTKKLLNFAPVRVTYGIAAAIVLKAPRIAFFSLSFLAIFWVGQQLYYKYAPADHFLDFYYAKVDDTTLGTEPLMTLCRRINYTGIRIEAYRTFIQFQGDDKKPVTVGEYNFEANVEKGDGNCTNVRLLKQPQREGTYKAFTEYAFYVNGNRKTGSYETNEYKMSSLALSTNDQIILLQDQIRILSEQIDELKKKSDDDSVNTPTSSPQPSSNNQSSQAPQQTAQAPSVAPTQPVVPSTPNTPPATTTPPPTTCILPIFSGGLLCGSDGILRL